MPNDDNPEQYAEVLAGIPDGVDPAIGGENAVRLGKLARMTDSDLSQKRLKTLIEQSFDGAEVGWSDDRWAEVAYIRRDTLRDMMTPGE